MKFTFYGGAGEIGGNKILLEDRDARVFLDMGVPFDFGERYFVEYLNYRDRFRLRDYFALNLLPRIPGLYSADWLAGTDLRHRRSEFSGVLISHIHWDHTNHLKYIDPEIPVYLGEGTRHILNSWQETSTSMDLGEHDYRTFRTGKTLALDGVDDEPIHVDHSAPAAYGHLLHTSEGAVAYTGDLRRHGPRGEFTDEFLERAAKEKPKVLLIEGTKVSPNATAERSSEADVLQGATEVVRKAKKHLVVATFYPRDVDRMRTFYQTAKKTGRIFVMSSKAAHLLGTLAADPRIDAKRIITDDAIRVYFREMKQPKPWEAELHRIFKDRAVGSDWVKKHQGEVILQLDFEQLTELIDIAPERGAQFIHSKSEPFEEKEMSDIVLHNWLDTFGLTYHQLHASGHLSMQEVKEAIEAVNPKYVVPVHTEHPELFTAFHPRVKLPKNLSSLEL